MLDPNSHHRKRNTNSTSLEKSEPFDSSCTVVVHIIDFAISHGFRLETITKFMEAFKAVKYYWKVSLLEILLRMQILSILFHFQLIT